MKEDRYRYFFLLKNNEIIFITYILSLLKINNKNFIQRDIYII